MYLNPILATTENAAIVVTLQRFRPLGLPFANVWCRFSATPEMAFLATHQQPFCFVIAFSAAINPLAYKIFFDREGHATLRAFQASLTNDLPPPAAKITLAGTIGRFFGNTSLIKCDRFAASPTVHRNPSPNLCQMLLDQASAGFDTASNQARSPADCQFSALANALPKCTQVSALNLDTSDSAQSPELPIRQIYRWASHASIIPRGLMKEQYFQSQYLKPRKGVPMTPAERKAAIARCDLEISRIHQEGETGEQPAYLIAMGLNDWEMEKKMLLNEHDRTPMKGIHPTVPAECPDVESNALVDVSDMATGAKTAQVPA